MLARMNQALPDVRVRPMVADDGARLVAFHARLSAESIRNRFFGVHPVLSDAEIEHFTHVDGRDRVAFVAIEGPAIVGVGRLERLPGTTDAEVAFVVADDHQGRGLGTRLLERLEIAAQPLGVTHFVADTLFSNTAMLHVLHRRHGSSDRVEDGVVHVRFPIAEVPSAPGLGTFASCAPVRTSVRST
jgi:GNAT superfamily N-acetyltransferase